MKWLIALLLLLPLSASSQTLQSGGGSISSGSTPIFGCTPGQILFSNGSVAQCSGMTSGTDGNGDTLSAHTGAAGLTLKSGTTSVLFLSSSQFISVATMLGISNAGSPASPDTGLSRLNPAVVGIGTGTPGNASGGVQTGNATLTSLTTGTNADFLCLSGGGAILIQTTACTISSLRFKPDWKLYNDDALSRVYRFEVGTFHLKLVGHNADPNAESLQAGLSAENVAAVAPECAIYEDDMKTPKSYRQECVIALLVKAIQQLKK